MYSLWNKHLLPCKHRTSEYNALKFGHFFIKIGSACPNFAFLIYQCIMVLYFFVIL